jgi:hypothetical protein
VLVLAFAGAAFARPGAARAQDQTTPAAPPVARGDHWELAGDLGYTTPPVRGGTTPFGLGLGGRLGRSFSGVYFGGHVVGYLGGQDVDVTDRSVVFGGELGYGFVADLGSGATFTFRPQVGAGGVVIFHTDPSLASGTSGTTTSTTTSGRRRPDTVSGASGQSSSDTTTTTAYYVEPGVGLMISSGSMLVGASAGALYLPSVSYGGGQPSAWLAYRFAGQVGFVF